MNERTTETVFLDPWEEYYDKQNTQDDNEQMEFSEQTVSCDDVQMSSEHTVHADHEFVQNTELNSHSQWQSNNNHTPCVDQTHSDRGYYHESHRHDEHQQSTPSIIESTNQYQSQPAEIITESTVYNSTHEIPSNKNFIARTSQIGNSESGNNKTDQVRTTFANQPYLKRKTYQLLIPIHGHN